MTVLVEGFSTGAFLLSEANGGRSREQVTIASGRNLRSGTVLGRQLLGTTAVAAALGTNTGNGSFGTINVNSPSIQSGAYVITFLAATIFRVEDPSGVQIGDGATGVAFNTGGLSFTITAGGTPFVAGDSFTVTPAGGSGKYVAFDPIAADGSQYPVGILLHPQPANATTADVVATMIARDAEVHNKKLVWGPNVTTDPQKAAALAAMAATARIFARIGM